MKTVIVVLAVIAIVVVGCALMREDTRRYGTAGVEVDPDVAYLENPEDQPAVSNGCFGPLGYIILLVKVLGG